jgi:hypothetical protein
LSAPPLRREEADRTIAACHEALEEGFGENRGGGQKTWFSEASRRLGIGRAALQNRLSSIKNHYGLEVDMSHYRPPAAFTVDPLPTGDDLSAEQLLDAQAERWAERKAIDTAKDLYDVRIGIDGPIAVGFFGDPHLDDPGFAALALRRDVETCRDTEGMFAVSVGDHRNNWVGRLMGLYANQEVTARQSLTLVEWFFASLPWLLTLGGNHDRWGNQHGDAAEIIHRLRNVPGVYQDHGARLRLNLPSGHSAIMHIRHDFPGGSQFNPAHALVRETLFGFRDHILVCGHRHQAGYIPIYHKDPARLCQGLRIGAYKDFDEYSKEKHFHGENWARSMGVVIDPAFAHDPVRFVKTLFSIEETAEYLTWRRGLWKAAKRKRAA